MNEVVFYKKKANLKTLQLEVGCIARGLGATRVGTLGLFQVD